MGKRLLSLCLVLALCLGLLPVTALAAEVDAPDNLYVGNQNVRRGNDTTYWNTNNSGELTQVSDATDDSNDWTVKYDPNSATLTLNEAKISGSYNEYNNPFTAGIYAKGSSNQSVALTIELIGTNTITGNYGIYVNAEISADSNGTDASLTITGENNGSLKVSGSFHGIYVKSGTGDASLNINDASVVAKTTQTYSGYAGVYVQSSANATSSPQLSLAVNGGSLTTSASEGNDGIQFYVGSSEATGATTSLTVTDNAIVRAKNGIKAERVDKPTPSGAGIVFDGDEGTVYGSVTLQEDITINKGESLTIPEGASLTIDSGATLTVDGGELTGENIPTEGVVYKVTGVTLSETTLTLEVGGEETLTATVAPTNATNKNMTWSSSNSAVATVDQNGNVEAVGAGTATITVKTQDGEKTASCTVTVTHVHTTTKTEARPATCTEAGNTEYWYCSGCHKYFADEAGTEETTLADTVIPATGHTFRGGWCAVCGARDPNYVPPNPSYLISVSQAQGGKVTASPTAAKKGDTVTLTVTPEDGYELADLTVTDFWGREVALTEQADGAYTFTMPASQVEIEAAFTQAQPPFTDVSEADWFYDEVQYVVDKGLMIGVSDTQFAPGANLTRAMLWTILARMDGETITGSTWAQDARAWAMDNGVSDGTDANRAVTREQLVTMLWRYTGQPEGTGDLSGFADGDTVSGWAQEAMGWSVGAGLIQGDENGLTPTATAIRAQIAAILMRFCEGVAG